MKAIGYIRVSSDRQALEGVSLDAQRECINQYCGCHGFELAELFADEGLSGRRADNRPGLQAALLAVRRCGGVLVVYSLSRLARSTRDCISIVDDLQGTDCHLAIISDRIDTTSSAGRFFFRLMASLAELESDQISDRVHAAFGYKRRRGELLSRWVPFGWDVQDGGVLVENQREQALLCMMDGWRAAGESYAGIAERLNGMDVKGKRGGRWHSSTVLRSLATWKARREAREVEAVERSGEAA